MQKDIYLDNSATTKPYNEVIEYMNHINSQVYGNPSSLHTKGIEAERLIKKAREAIALSLKVSDREIIFTSGGTESNNLAIRGFLEANPRRGKHIVTTKIEHPSVLEVYKYLSTKGYDVDFLEVDNTGGIKLDSLRALIKPETSLVSIIIVNNETGVVQSLEEIIPIIKSINKEAVIHIDGVQGYGKIDINPKKLQIDMLSISSHKIHGPKGVGALYVNRNIRLKPILFGGGQEAFFRSGTENVPGICGFGLASEMIFKEFEENLKKVKEMRGYFLNNLTKNIENYDIISTETSSPYILNIAFHGLRAEVLLHHLEERNIFVSTGSACSSRKKVHSHVLAAMGVDPKKIDGAIRFSFSHTNTENEIDEVLGALKEIVPKIKIKNRN